jgi:hypothetical protein
VTSSPVSTNRRLLIVATVVAGLIVITAGVAFGVRVLLRTAGGSSSATSCTAGDYTVDTDQAAVASTMVGVVITRALPERAAVLVLAAALQESKLRNLPSGAGDRDSVGVLQQRPSQGWGTIEQLGDLHYATGKFLDALVRQPNWQTESLADAIQAVQISADGSLYAQHEGEAQALADALTGATPAGISCRFPTPKTAATAAEVGAGVSADLPVNPPNLDVARRSVTVPGAAWATAAWFVANAERFGIDSVGYAQRQWTRGKGWHTDDTIDANAVVTVLHKS